jgi:hypothetical protein
LKPVSFPIIGNAACEPEKIFEKSDFPWQDSCEYRNWEENMLGAHGFMSENEEMRQ